MYGLKMDGVWNVWIMYELCCIYLLVPVNQKKHFPAGRPPEEILANFFHGLRMNCVLIVHGLFMDYVLIMYESCMDFIWLTYGLCMVYVWIMYGLC